MKFLYTSSVAWNKWPGYIKETQVDYIFRRKVKKMVVSSLIFFKYLWWFLNLMLIALHLWFVCLFLKYRGPQWNLFYPWQFCNAYELVFLDVFVLSLNFWQIKQTNTNKIVTNKYSQQSRCYNMMQSVT